MYHSDVCGREIRYGNAILEISRNVEQHDYEEETGHHEVTVIDSDRLVTACARCGNCLADRKEIWKHLVRALGLPRPANEADAAQPAEDGMPQTCDCCGIEMVIGRACVSLVRLIGQIDWNDELDDSELFIIDGEDLLSFCPEYGNKMNTSRLRQALHGLMVSSIRRLVAASFPRLRE